MKKALIIIGIYLIVQTCVGFAAVLCVAITSGCQATSVQQIPANMLLVALVISSILSSIATTLICGKGTKAVFQRMPTCKSPAKILLLCLLTTLPLVVLSNGLIEVVGLPDNMNGEFSEMSTCVWALPVLAVIGPLAEEICFRYGVTGELLKQMPASPVKVIVISALIFGVIHMNPAQMLSAFLLGLYFAWLYVKTRSIWPSVVCHVCNNTIAVVTMRLLPQDDSISSLLPAPVYIYLVLAVAIVVAMPLLFVLNKKLTP